MSEFAKKARSAMREKISRLTRTDPKQKVDGSSYVPPEPLDAGVKTGLRPVSRRQFKKGGKVVAMHGHAGKPRADRKARKNGGSTPATPDNIINRDVKEANEKREGKKHIGGMKKGGRAHKMDGGDVAQALSPAFAIAKNKKLRQALSPLAAAADLKRGGKAKHEDVKTDKALVKKAVHKHEASKHPGKPKTKLRHGGYAHKAAGGYQAGGASTQAATTSADFVTAPRPVKRNASNVFFDADGVPEVRVVHDSGKTKYPNFREQTSPQVLQNPPQPVDVDRYVRPKPPEMPEDVANDFNAYKISQEVKREEAASKVPANAKPKKNRGGALDGTLQGTRPTGGRLARKDGGRNNKKKGSMNVNIIIGDGSKQPAGMAGRPPMPPPGIPVPVGAPPPAGMGGPPGMAPPMPPIPMGPPPGAMGGMPPGGMPPIPRKTGGRAIGVDKPGRVGHRTYHEASDMDAGSAGGLGKLEKISIQRYQKGKR